MKTIILGLGKTGLSTARYLAFQGDELIICDTRDNPPNLELLKEEFPNIEIYLGKLQETVLLQADRIVISPGLSIHDDIFKAVREKNIPLISDIELFAQAVTAPVVAITGSNGKSTVTTIVGEMGMAAGLNVIVAGNIGTPVCDLLNKPQPDLYVLELSSFQLATTYSLAPEAATVLNVTPDHLDWHRTFDDYRTSKLRIYHDAAYKIFNRDDDLTYIRDAAFSFGKSEPETIKEFGLTKDYLMQGSKKLLAIADLKIKGVHNQLNALAALALGTAIKLPLDAMQKALREFSGLAHRCEWVAEFNGVQWYDDSKATNVDAAVTAIAGLAPTIQGKIVLIAGGDAKGAELSALQPVVQAAVRCVMLFGKDADLLEKTLTGCTEIIRVNSLKEAVVAAAQQAKTGDVVLLAPACSSLDMFVDYQDRGRQFKGYVLELCQK